MIPNSKILIVVGPTASGKSELAASLAKKFNGEIISCDSRQIYKGMDIGTGKVEGKWSKIKIGKNHGRDFYTRFVYKGITHHLIDFANAKKQYSASEFQKAAQKKIAEIIKRGRLPILCGGTMHWIDAVVYNQTLPEVKPNLKLRARLERQSADILFSQLSKLDPARAATIDRFNSRRLIRALEIVITTGKPVPVLSTHYSPPTTHYDALWLGINPPQDILYSKIEKRLKQRIKQGMVAEVKKLHKQGLSWKRLEGFGLEYKFCGLLLQKKISKDEMFSQLLMAIKHYAKRQMTWWKRNTNIIWVKPDKNTAFKLTKKFLA